MKLPLAIALLAMMNLPAAHAQDFMRDSMPADKIEIETTPSFLMQARGGSRNVFAKLSAAQPVTIAYLGGSITAGAGASREEKSYRALTTTWFREQFPLAKISEVDASIGGTGSDLGAFRVGRDVLDHKPDLIFVEFAVNDGGASPAQILRASEGIVRQARRALPLCDIAFVYTFVANFQDELARGNLVRSMAAHDRVAAHYNIPAINVALPIAQRIKDATMIAAPRKDAEGNETSLPHGVELFASDGVHPRDGAMQIYADTITNSMSALRNAGATGPRPLPAPLASDNWEEAKLVAIEKRMLSPKWKILDSAQGLGKQFSKYLPQMWEASAGQTLHFRFKGRAARLFDIVGPDGGQVLVTVDGKKSQRPTPRFDSFASYHRLQTLDLWSGQEGVHTIEIEIDSAQPDRSSVTDKEKDKPNFDAKKYDGTAVRIGWIMLLGELE